MRPLPWTSTASGAIRAARSISAIHRRPTQRSTKCRVAGMSAAEKLRIVVRLSLKPDGGLRAQPMLLEASASPHGPAMVQSVLTALSRLHAKGALTREPFGRGYAYALPADPGSAVTARRMSRLLDSREDRAGVLARFVADLSAEDEQLLTELLRGDRRDPEARP